MSLDVPASEGKIIGSVDRVLSRLSNKPQAYRDENMADELFKNA